jgi:hypothetical protein
VKIENINREGKWFLDKDGIMKAAFLFLRICHPTPGEYKHTEARGQEGDCKGAPSISSFPLGCESATLEASAFSEVCSTEAETFVKRESTHCAYIYGNYITANTTTDVQCEASSECVFNWLASSAT